MTHVSRPQLPTLKTKSQLYPIITQPNGVPDYLAVNLYWDTVRPQASISRQVKTSYSRLGGHGVSFRYRHLSRIYCCSAEAIRKKLVRLERLGLIQRDFLRDPESFNQLVIYVWRQTPHFINLLGTNRITDLSSLV